jgi:response regulator of citrate/malate metabolism
VTAPAGLVGQTVAASITALRNQGELSAPELAELIGTSRVTARRYLEHLVDIGSAARDHRYLGTGRPTVVYRWQAH